MKRARPRVGKSRDDEGRGKRARLYVPERGNVSITRIPPFGVLREFTRVGGREGARGEGERGE